MVCSLQLQGFPHSDISGSIPVCRSPELFAAYHVLLRFRKPRHPPFALVLFLFVNHLRLFVSSFYSFCLEIVALQLEKTRIIIQTIISFYLVISLSIVNELNTLHSSVRCITKKTVSKVQGTSLEQPRASCQGLAPKRRCSSHTFRYGYLVTT